VSKPFGFAVSAGETMELNITRNDGEAAVAEMRAVEIDWEGQTACLASLRDITERKRAEEKRVLMEQQLQLAGRLAVVGEMAASIAHELNDPLTAIQMYAQILYSRDDIDVSLKSDVETVVKEAQRAVKTIKNLLSFTRMHCPEKRVISINDAIASILELHAYRMRVNNIDVRIDLDPDLPATIAEFDQLQQVFANIITNAEQVMTEARQGGKFTIKTQKADGMIRISFIDDGPGITDENVKRIFDPFFTTKEPGKGTGLGLSICHSIIEEHNGSISVESRIGEGATFVVEIPVVTEVTASAG